jgi:lysophospholipase L1-like esterase
MLDSGSESAFSTRISTHTDTYQLRLTSAPSKPVTVTIRTDPLTLIEHGQIQHHRVEMMPIGDSITYGVIDSKKDTESGGYRASLWQLLQADGYRVNFVGSQANGPASFDNQHEGYRGQTIEQIARSVQAQLARYRPDVVLLLAGTNDINRDNDLVHAPQRLKHLIEQIFKASPHTAVLVGTLPPNTRSANNLQQVQAFNRAVRRFVNSPKQHDLQVVDLYKQLGLKDLTDQVHPTDRGYRQIAYSWYKSLINVLNRSQFSSLSHTQKLTFTPQNWNKPQSITVAASGKTGAQHSVIRHQLSSEDAQYSNLTADLPVRVVNQQTGIKVVLPHRFELAPDALTGAQTGFSAQDDLLTDQPSLQQTVTFKPRHHSLSWRTDSTTGISDSTLPKDNLNPLLWQPRSSYMPCSDYLLSSQESFTSQISSRL